MSPHHQCGYGSLKFIRTKICHTIEVVIRLHCTSRLKVLPCRWLTLALQDSARGHPQQSSFWARPGTYCRPPTGPGTNTCDRSQLQWSSHNFNGLVINKHVMWIMTKIKGDSCGPAPGLHQRPHAGLLQGSTRNILQAPYRTRCEHMWIDHRVTTWLS